MNPKLIIFLFIFVLVICFCVFGCTTGEVPPISESYQASLDLVHKPYFLNNRVCIPFDPLPMMPDIEARIVGLFE